MKILVITDLYPISENEKYTPKTIKSFVKEWQKQGHEVKVIKPNFIFNSLLRGKPIYKSGIYNEVENINYLLPFCGNLKNKVKTPLEADLIIAHMPSGLIFANKLDLNFCAGVHVSDLEVLTKPLYRFYFKSELEKSYKNAKKIACRSYVLKNKFLKLYSEFESKTFVAPSGISFEPAKRNWNPHGKIKVLTCGQFIKRKNIDKVIKACQNFDNIELTVIGSGKEEKFLKNIANALNLVSASQKTSSNVIFTGQLPHDDVLKKMRESDIFILPSVNETFGMVYIEAMASGCITVCTENDGIDGIIKDSENGFLTVPDNIEETLLRIINFSDKNTILYNAYKTVQQYTESSVAENYLNEILDK